MAYGKLPVMILSEMVSGDSNDTNALLAAYVLEHFQEIKDDSIRDLAAKTHVSASSISRFCRAIGLRDYMELKELTVSKRLKFEICSQSDIPAVQKDDYISAVTDSMERVRRSIDMEKLERLARDIRRYPRVSIFGVVKGETAAMNLQTDLAILGKAAVTKLRYAEQTRHLSKTGSDDLLIIFSYTGAFYDYGYPRIDRAAGKPGAKIYFITSDPKAKQNPFYDEVIWFESLQNQASHPYQLQLVAGLIAQTYAHLLKEQERNARETL